MNHSLEINLFLFYFVRRNLNSPDVLLLSAHLSGQTTIYRTFCHFRLICPVKQRLSGETFARNNFVHPNAISPDDLPHPLFHAKWPFPGQILRHLCSWHSLERLSLFCGQREKRINLVLRQPQHPADLAIRGTELVAEFPGEIKSLRFGQVLNR